MTEHRLSERHACALVGLSRDAYRHVGQASALNVELRDEIIQTAQTRLGSNDFESDAIARLGAVSRRIKCLRQSNAKRVHRQLQRHLAG